MLQLKFTLPLVNFTVGTYQCTAVGNTAQGSTDTSPAVPFPVPNRWARHRRRQGGLLFGRICEAQGLRTAGGSGALMTRSSCDLPDCRLCPHLPCSPPTSGWAIQSVTLSGTDACVKTSYLSATSGAPLGSLAGMAGMLPSVLARPAASRRTLVAVGTTGHACLPVLQMRASLVTSSLPSLPTAAATSCWRLTPPRPPTPAA